MDPVEYVRKRKNEVLVIENDILAHNRNINKQSFQRIPRFLRRRAASHNTKRQPSRFRSAIPSKSATRKLKSNRAKKGKDGICETLKWHSKRCEMSYLYGLRLPIATNEKLLKSCLKNSTSKRCFIHDMSYFGVFTISQEANMDTFGESYGTWNWSQFGKSPIIICKSQGCSIALVHPTINAPNGFIPQKDTCSLFLIGPLSDTFQKEILSLNLNVRFFNSTDSFGTLILVERAHAYLIWKKLVYMGASYGAMREMKKVTLELGIPFMPDDFISPDTVDYFDNFCRESLKSLVAHKPKSKINFSKFHKELDSIINIQSQNLFTVSICLFHVLGKGRVDRFAAIESDDGEKIGVITRCDFSELRGKVVAFGSVFSSSQIQANSHLNCQNMDGNMRRIMLIKVIL